MLEGGAAALIMRSVLSGSTGGAEDVMRTLKTIPHISASDAEDDSRGTETKDGEREE